MEKQGKVYINGRFIGFHNNPEKVTRDLIGARREGKIDPIVNVAFHGDTNEVYINTDAGRVQRPLIVVENGKSLLTEDLVKQVTDKKLTWKDLVAKGIIEYLDAEEEENTLVAVSEPELNKNHTHLEVDGAAIFSIVTGMIPYVTHNMAGKSLHGAKMFKQALGFGASNLAIRTDTESYMLQYPQKHMIKTKVMDLIGMAKRPQVINMVVAILPYRGFNMLDAVVLNKGAVERGMGRAFYYRNYESFENRYPGGQKDQFERPTEETVGFMGEEFYKHIGEDGLAAIGTAVEGKKAVLGKTPAPPPVL